LLAEANVPVLDTDHICHDIEAQDAEIRAALRQCFGQGIFDDSGKLNRKRLGRIVFDNAACRHELNRIVHPAIIRECRRQIAEYSNAPLVAVLAPLLFETGQEKQYDEIWTVTASDAGVRERLKARDGISDEDADKRIKAQFSQQEKITKSHHVIDNSGTVDDTRRQVLDLLNRQAN
jgi:dephospho-CoA kinase